MDTSAEHTEALAVNQGFKCSKLLENVLQLLRVDVLTQCCWGKEHAVRVFLCWNRSRHRQKVLMNVVNRHDGTNTCRKKGSRSSFNLINESHLL